MTDKKLRLYISGKITGDPEYKLKFFEAELMLGGAAFGIPNAKDYLVSNPARINETDWKTAMKAAIMLMMCCDGVALLPDWEKSKGAKIERELALALDMTVKPIGEWE